MVVGCPGYWGWHSNCGGYGHFEIKFAQTSDTCKLKGNDGY